MVVIAFASISKASAGTSLSDASKCRQELPLLRCGPSGQFFRLKHNPSPNTDESVLKCSGNVVIRPPKWSDVIIDKNL